MLKSVLTPKNIILATFSVVTIGIISYFVLISTDFNFSFQESKQNKTESTSEKQYETVKVPGVVLYPIYGSIKEIDKKTKAFTITNALDNKEYRLQYKNQIINDVGDQTLNFKDLEVGSEIGVFSKKEFDETIVIDYFDYISIIPETSNSVGGQRSVDLPTIGSE